MLRQLTRLSKQVQRLKALEEIYAELVDTEDTEGIADAAEADGFYPAAAAGGGLRSPRGQGSGVGQRGAVVVRGHR